MTWRALHAEVLREFTFDEHAAQYERQLFRAYCCHAATVKEYRTSPEGRPAVSATNAKYYRSAKGQAAQARHNERRRAAYAAQSGRPSR